MLDVGPAFAYHGDLVAYIGSQLPRQVAEKVSIVVSADPYLLRTTATFKDDKGRQHQCQLEEVKFGSRTMACRIPEEFISHLCVVICGSYQRHSRLSKSATTI